MMVALVATSSCTTSKSVRLKVMTYNIHSARDSNNETIAKIIKENNPDLVALQEVERNTKINPGDIPAIMAQLTDMGYYYFAHALNLKQGDYGNAILSKYPIIEGNTIKLGTQGKDYIRSFGYVKIEKEGKKIYFGVTHLDHMTDSLRLKQVNQILEEIKDINKPFILAGDLNSVPDSPVISKLKERFILGSKEDKLEWTDPAPVPNKTIDYIMFSPSTKFEVRSYKVDYNAKGASDHFPLVSEIKIINNSKD